MLKHFQNDLDVVHQQMLAMSGVVEKMTGDAVRALCERKYELVSQVLEADAEVDEAEVRIEEECLKMLALHQPVARDLRRVTTLIKINMDLERIGDLACNIAERAESLKEFPHFPPPEMLTRMSSIALDMVRMSLDSFVNYDSAMAKKVIQTDDQVDQMNFEAIKYLRELMNNDGNHIQAAMHCFSAVRHIERIADHAENISEDVIYMIDGDIVRHRHGDFSE